jgi:hypothetical protein
MIQSKPVTFRTLAQKQDHSLPATLPQEWPLEKWFAAVIDLPLEALTVFDLARACRQNIYVDAVMPYCLRALEAVPLSGELYDGELLAAVMGLPTEFWVAHPQQRDSLIAVCRVALLETDDEDLKREIEEWLAVQED